jgi:two-component system OmpR family response regulator
LDTSIIYTKTARGVIELKNGGKGLAAPQVAALKRIDGRSSIALICAGMTEQEQSAITQIFAALETLQMIRIFARREDAPVKVSEEMSFDSEALPTIRIQELGPEEAVLAWAEARRGSRELVQLGFYATAHIDPEGNITHDRSALIVEDDPSIAMLMKTYLAKRGFILRVVADGQEALQVLDEKPTPHLVLLDVNLPNINGFDILAYIRASENLKHLPAIMVTAQVSDADVLRGLKGGADGYIFKPFQWTAFYECIKRVLGIKEESALKS